MSTTTGALIQTTPPPPPPSVAAIMTTTTMASIGPGRKKEVIVPQDLDVLSKDALVTLVRDLDEERQALTSELDVLGSPLLKKRKTTGSVQTQVTAASVVVSPVRVPVPVVTPTAKEVTAVRKRMGKNAERAIKKMKHGNKKKPTSEVSEGGMTPAMVHEIMKDYDAHQTSDTKRMTKWVLLDNDAAIISNMLGIDRLIHPVQFDGKVICWAGNRNPKIYCWASLERMEVKYDKAQCNLNLKIKTTEAGTGSPDYKPLLLAFAKGEIDHIPSASYW
uniref:Uncharacterized protein n=1 Tax=Attheya septentrionalis TaxID=420275 RepID=A0A7S2ULU4_9STRA|mmetsp:Transcript_396/g.676  ORF Transcript_396/g.676 Transcript_396/m.676 type:complete len:276 (+) Transcript_396:16-843(+)